MKNCLFAVAVLCCILLMAALPAVADSQARIVRLSSVQGEVSVNRQAGSDREKAILNMPVTQGMSLATGADGRAEVEFEDGTVIQAAPTSEISFKQLSLRSSGEKVSSIAIQHGTVYFNVGRKGKDEFSVVLADRELQVKKTARFRVIASDEQARLAVFKGEVSFADSSEPGKIKKGEELTLNRADGRFVAASIGSGEFDTWAKERTDYHDRYYLASSYKSYPYYGRGDLGFYGGWYDIPGYGAIWRPNNVGFGWEPFADGYWSWYPGYGYMWVSGYPWGWLPYRYGSWAYVSGWGWGWLPYGNWSNWRPSPGVINKPPDYQRPQPPSGNTPSHPTIHIWHPPRVPRGPFLDRPSEGGLAASPRPAPPSGIVLPPARPPRLERQANGFVPPPFARGNAGQGGYPRERAHQDIVPGQGLRHGDGPNAALHPNSEPRHGDRPRPNAGSHPDAAPRQGFEPRHNSEHPGSAHTNPGPRPDMGPRQGSEPRHDSAPPSYSRPQSSAPATHSMPTSMPSGSRAESAPAPERGQGRTSR